MYSVLIVDDEELICKGLKSMLERNCQEYIHGISFTMNPNSVIESINDIHPDIVITDIRMPEMSGLDLIRLVKGKYPQIKFIALSGYDDFKYVKEAFNLGVMDYLLKPASVEELNTVIGKVITAIEDERHRDITQKSDDLRLKNAIMENTLNKLFAGINIEEDSFNTFLTDANEFFPYPYFAIAMIYKLNSNDNIGDNEWVASNTELQNEYFTKLEGVNVFSLFNLNNYLILIMNMDIENRLKNIVDQLELFITVQKDREGLELFAAISDINKGVKSILKCYNEAVSTLSYRMLAQSRRITLYQEIASFSKEVNYEKQLLKLKDGILNANKVGISSLIDGLFDYSNLKGCTIESIQRMYISIIRVIEESASANGVLLLPGLEAEFARFNDLSDIRIHLKTLILDVIAKIINARKNRSAADVVKEYVHKNIHKDIDLASAANMVSISYAHFSKLFKDETGMNFSDYLIKARMEKALVMLSNPVNKVQDISNEVGYTNPKHFTRAFKNFFGFSPSEYRNH